MTWGREPQKPKQQQKPNPPTHKNPTTTHNPTQTPQQQQKKPNPKTHTKTPQKKKKYQTNKNPNIKPTNKSHVQQQYVTILNFRVIYVCVCARMFSVIGSKCITSGYHNNSTGECLFNAMPRLTPEERERAVSMVLYCLLALSLSDHWHTYIHTFKT